MKSLNAKRIAALAASLVMGLAFAGPVVATASGVTIGNGFSVINSAGTPTVQIVVGSQAQPSDGVVAANIAAVIGNLAYVSSKITATVNGLGAVTCAVTTPTCTLSNQQVWLGVKGLSAPTGSYAIKTLIGSVMNGGVLNYNTLSNTKAVISGSSQYTYPEGNSPYPVTSSPEMTSAFAGIGSISIPGPVSATTNGGGFTGKAFTQSGFDNVVELSTTQIPSLLSASGQYSESEYLWLMGFPVYNQQTNVSNFQLLDGNGAYQVVFGKPISIFTSAANAAAKAYNHAGFRLLGTNWTIYNVTLPNVNAPSSGNFVVGTTSSEGTLQLAQSQVPLTLLYVGQNMTAGPLTIALQDLTYPNQSGASKAVIGVYKNGVLTNESTISPLGTATINASGTTAYIYVSATTPGLYASQRWAKIQVFSNIFNVTNGQKFGSSNPNWLTSIRWSTNQSTGVSGTLSGTEATNAVLEGIVIYSNLSKAYSLTPGQSLGFIQNPLAFNLTFSGDALGTPSATNSNFDAQTFSSTTATGGSDYTYGNPNGDTTANPGAQTFSTGLIASVSAAANAVNATVVTEPVNLFTVQSSLPTAFQITSHTGIFPSPSTNQQKVLYNLDGYSYVPNNVLDGPGSANILTYAPNNYGVVLQIHNNGVDGNYVTNNNQLTVSISGSKWTSGQGTASVSGFGFNPTNSIGTATIPVNVIQQGMLMKNVTNVNVGYPLPAPGVTVYVYDTANVFAFNATSGANSILMGTLSYYGPTLLYSVPQYNYWQAPNALTANVVYTESGYTQAYTLKSGSTTPGVAREQYWSYVIPEIAVPQTGTTDANMTIGLTNQSTSNVGSTPEYWLNQTSGNNNKLIYTSYQGTATQAVQGFRTERGSGVGPITSTSVTYYLAQSIDTLNFLVGPAKQGSLATTQTVGPFKIGQTYNNITIENVSATCAFAATSCKVSGLTNVTATPSATTAITAVPLNTAATPIAVLDSNASSTQNLIVVGSKFVNSVAATIFANQPTFASGFNTGSVVVQQFGNQYLVAGWTAAQTVSAGNQFIQQLLSAAATST